VCYISKLKFLGLEFEISSIISKCDAQRSRVIQVNSTLNEGDMVHVYLVSKLRQSSEPFPSR
jgi:hypothetical protein